MPKKILLLIVFLVGTTGAYAQKTLTLAELRQEIEAKDDTLRIINLWATWCKPCVEELPSFMAVGKTQAKGAKVKFLLVAVEDKPEKVQTFLQNKGYLPQVNSTTAFYVLIERDANIWIPQIDTKWEGEIPATLLVCASCGVRAFQAKQFTQSELESFIASYSKKN